MQDANAFTIGLVLVSAGIEITKGVTTLIEKDKLAAEYAKLVPEASRPYSVREILERGSDEDKKSLMLFWALATSPYRANAQLSSGAMSGTQLCSADQFNSDRCNEAKKLLRAAAAAAGN